MLTLGIIASTPHLICGGLMFRLRCSTLSVHGFWKRRSARYLSNSTEEIPSVEDVLGPKGLLAREHPRYEHRDAQIKMANHVYKNLSVQSDTNTMIIEAPTGVGKTLGYLVPAFLTKLRQDGARGGPIFISTNTKTLQHQIIEKDAPLLKSILGALDVQTAFGRSSYFSLRLLYKMNKRCIKDKKDRALSGESNPEQDAIAEEVSEIIKKVKWDDKLLYMFDNIPRTHPETRLEIQSDRKNCKGNRCLFYEKCTFQRDRKSLEKADIIVVNHALYLADKVVRSKHAGRLLPNHDSVIIDEAHDFESVAKQQFVTSISWERIQVRLDKIYGTDSRGKPKGILKKVENDHKIDAIREDLVSIREKMERLFGKFADELDDIKWEDRDTTPKKVYGSDDCDLIPDDIERLCKQLTDYMNARRKGDSEVASQLAEETGYTDMDFQAEVEKLSDLVSDIREWLAGAQNLPESEKVHWLERAEDGPQTPISSISMSFSPIFVGPELKEVVFGTQEGARSVTLTSATIAVQPPSFKFFKDWIGLNDENTTDIILKSPFDLKRQAQVVTYAKKLEGRDREREIWHYISKGNSMILFTSFSDLFKTLECLTQRMKDEQIIPFVQEKGQNLHPVVERFKKCSKGVLFVVSSGWQGVDIKGAGLSTVIIPKVPFQAGFTSVLSQAQDRGLKEQNQNLFMAYSVPNAILKLQQGCGRLIRSKTDTGTIVILDSALHDRTKHYSSLLRSALDEYNVVKKCDRTHRKIDFQILIFPQLTIPLHVPSDWCLMKSSITLYGNTMGSTNFLWCPFPYPLAAHVIRNKPRE